MKMLLVACALVGVSAARVNKAEVAALAQDAVAEDTFMFLDERGMTWVESDAEDEQEGLHETGLPRCCTNGSCCHGKAHKRDRCWYEGGLCRAKRHGRWHFGPVHIR